MHDDFGRRAFSSIMSSETLLSRPPTRSSPPSSKNGLKWANRTILRNTSTILKVLNFLFVGVSLNQHNDNLFTTLQEICSIRIACQACVNSTVARCTKLQMGNKVYMYIPTGESVEHFCECYKLSWRISLF